MAHLNVVGIHPWRDGNGRTARALHTLVVARAGEVAPEFSSDGPATEISQAATADIRGPGRDPYERG